MAVVASKESCPVVIEYAWTEGTSIGKFWGSVECSGVPEGQRPSHYYGVEEPVLTKQLRPMYQHGYLTRYTRIVVELQERTLSPKRWDSGWDQSRWPNEMCIALWEEQETEWRHMDPTKVVLLKNSDNASIKKITISCQHCIQGAELAGNLLRPLLDKSAQLVKEYLLP